MRRCGQLPRGAAAVEGGRLVTEGRQLVNEKTGEPFTIEYLDYSDINQRFVLPYGQSLEKIGIKIDYRVVDSSAYRSGCANLTMT